MDNVLVDTLPVLNDIDMTDVSYQKPDQIPNIFLDLPIKKGAKEAVMRLSQDYDCYILSTAPWQNPSAWTDKILWLEKHFGSDEKSPFYKKVILTHEKGVARANGGILIDDRPYHGASQWDDKDNASFWIQYGYDPRLTWESGELEQLLLDAYKIFDERGLNERASLLMANHNEYNLFNPEKTFKKESWE